MAERPHLGLPVTPAESEAILAELARARDEPPQGDAASAGCAVAIVSIIAIVLMPFVGRGLDLSSNAMLAIGLSLGAVTLAGGVLGIFGDSSRRRVDARLARRISCIVSDFSSGDPDQLLRETVRLLEGAYLRRGPRTVNAFDVPAVAERLGESLPYVERIESFLVGRGEILAVFTPLERGDNSAEGASPTT